MEYFRLKNFEKYQHRDALRRSGPMLFIRMDVASLWDEKLLRLSPMQQLTWYRLLLYAGQTRNRVERDSNFLKRVLHLKFKPNLSIYEEFGLIEDYVASNLPAKLPPRGEERRGEESRSARASAPAESPLLKIQKKEASKNGHQAWDDVMEYIQKNGPQNDDQLPFDLKLKQVLVSVGRIRKIRNCHDSDFPFLKNEFVKKYNELSQGGSA